MKIDAVRCLLVEHDEAPHRGTGVGNRNSTGRTQGLVVTIATDSGIEGFAMVGGPGSVAGMTGLQLCNEVASYLMGRDPSLVGRIWSDLQLRVRSWRLSESVIAAVDLALWDIVGKTAGMPIHKLLGSCRDRVNAYASSSNLEAMEAYAEQAIQLRESGYHAYKIHPHGEPDEDIAICRAVRAAVGEEWRLMLDPAARYDYPSALRVGRHIEDLGFHWYEEPMPETDIYGYAKLCADLDISVVAPETAPGGLDAVAPFVTDRAADLLRTDVERRGGITGMIKTAHLAEGFHMGCEVHTGSNPASNLANLHVIGAIPNTEYFEVMLPKELREWGAESVIRVASDGTVEIPNRPGLGLNLDWDLIHAHTVHTFE